jgi:Flp pilus assembly protein TadG
VRVDRTDFRSCERGSAVIEFTLLLPLLLLLFIGMANLCILLDEQLRLIHLGREAASVFSRGTGFEETFEAIGNADGNLDLDGPGGRVILTRISLIGGQPVITAQQSIGGLNRSSRVGTLPGNATSAPATVPNGRTIPTNMSLVVVELFSRQQYILGNTRFAPGQGAIVLGSLAAF